MGDGGNLFGGGGRSKREKIFSIETPAIGQAGLPYDYASPSIVLHTGYAHNGEKPVIDAGSLPEIVVTGTRKGTAKNRWNGNNENPAEQWAKAKLNGIKVMSDIATKEAITEKRKRQVSTSDRRRNVANIQSELYKLGYFGEISSDKAIDGIWGRKTEAAYQKALKEGYTSDGYRLIGDTGFPMIREHKKKYGVTEPYVVVDK